MTDEMSLDAPLEPGEPRRPDDARTTDKPDDGDQDGLAEVLTREGADAPDAADIDDPDRQL